MEPQSLAAEAEGARECVPTAEELLALLRRLASLNSQLEGVVSVPLDAELTLKQCAAWLQMTPKQLSVAVRAKAIPANRVGGAGRPVFRFHPRTILEETRYGGRKVKI